MKKSYREKHAKMKKEFDKSDFVFDPNINSDELSISEMQDLLMLAIGESTFTDRDVKRIG